MLKQKNCGESRSKRPNKSSKDSLIIRESLRGFNLMLEHLIPQLGDCVHLVRVRRVVEEAIARHQTPIQFMPKCK